MYPNHLISSPDEALMALAIMHNYAPEEYKVSNCIEPKYTIKLFNLSVQECGWAVRLLQWKKVIIQW